MCAAALLNGENIIDFHVTGEGFIVKIEAQICGNTV